MRKWRHLFFCRICCKLSQYVKNIDLFRDLICNEFEDWNFTTIFKNWLHDLFSPVYWTLNQNDETTNDSTDFYFILFYLILFYFILSYFILFLFFFILSLIFERCQISEFIINSLYIVYLFIYRIYLFYRITRLFQRNLSNEENLRVAENFASR